MKHELKDIKITDITTYPHLTANISVSAAPIGMYWYIDAGIGGCIECFMRKEDLDKVLEEIKKLDGQ